MYDSHVSLRDDYEVSTDQLDAFVELARENGSQGARLTGAGFGGCAVALVPADAADMLAREARRRFAEEGFEEPAFYKFRPAAGAELAG
jgi:galactokinase